MAGSRRLTWSACNQTRLPRSKTAQRLSVGSLTIQKRLPTDRETYSDQLGSIPIRSLTAPRNRCLQPRYFKCAAAHLKYARVDLETKAKAIAQCEPQPTK